jgi:hypothetical protein
MEQNKRLDLLWGICHIRAVKSWVRLPVSFTICPANALGQLGAEIHNEPDKRHFGNNATD